MYSKIFRFLGSIQFAVPVLSAIIGILIWATFYESQVGSTTVQHEIYKSSWFGALMFLLALNLGISALSRYPWRGARKVGFALTHFGLIAIIAGSAAVIHLGVEGMLPLRVASGANNQIRVEGDLLEVMMPAGEVKQANVFVKPDGSVSPQQVAGLSLLGYSDSTMKTVRFAEGATVANPAVRLSLRSTRMGQTLERWVAAAPAAYARVPIGPAELAIQSVESETELQGLLAPPVEENRSPWGTIQAKMEGEDAIAIDVGPARTQTVQLGDKQIQLVNAWSDFRLDENNQPTNASNTLNNPAVQLEVSAPEGRERWFLFGRDDFAPIRTIVSGDAIAGIELHYEVPPQQPQNYFRVFVTPDSQLFYAAHSSQGFKSGELSLGQSVSPGWADFQITLEEFVPHAQLNRQIVPVSNPNSDGTPALLLRTEAGTKAWLPWGEPTTIRESDGEILAAFTPKLLQLPFSIALEDFIVDRNEGTDSVAMWTSNIRIEDPHSGVVSHRRVWMNHPTWYDGWKIAQASWNPGDLKQSTLQVKREPLWVTALTWSGSALVVGGIGVMFYGPVVARKLRRQPQSVREPEPPTIQAVQEF